jgi:hypothetical protein
MSLPFKGSTNGETRLDIAINSITMGFLINIKILTKKRLTTKFYQILSETKAIIFKNIF